MPSGRSELDQGTADLLRMARAAVEQGQFRLAVCLYLAAFERDLAMSKCHPSPATVAGIRKAWAYSCDLKDRAVLEHMLERAEPFLSADNVAEYSRQLQALSLEKLEDFGIPHEDVEDMADFLNNMAEMPDDFVAKLGFGSPDSKRISTVENELVSADAPYGMKIDTGKPAVGAKGGKSDSAKGAKAPATKDSLMGEDTANQQISYRDLASYDGVIEQMKQLGIGIGSDARYVAFLDMLSRRHGIDPQPTAMPIIFRSQAREDATFFMQATVGEMHQPSVRVHMDTTSQGVSMLSITATTEVRSRQQLMQMSYDSPAVVILEDVDLWAEPIAGLRGEELQAAAMKLEYGMRDAIMMIRAAITNPNVTVMASCASEASIDALLFGILDPVTVVDIELPTLEERTALWKWLSSKFPSLRYLDLDELSRLTESLTRYDICSAAGDAVEQAYHESVTRRAYVPVTRENLYDKIAACQPLESDEYLEIQEQAVECFRKDLDRLDDLIFGED